MKNLTTIFTMLLFTGILSSISGQEWNKYTISTKRIDLSCIRSGLVIFSSSIGFEHEIFIDDVVFE